MNDTGLKFFAKNLKSAIYGTETSASRKRSVQRDTQPRSNQNSRNQFEFYHTRRPPVSNQVPRRPSQLPPSQAPPIAQVHQQPYLYSQAVNSNLPIEKSIGAPAVPDPQTILNQTTSDVCAAAIKILTWLTGLVVAL